MEDDLRFTQSLGKWEAALAVFQAMVKRDSRLRAVEFRGNTRMGGTITIGLHLPGGWTGEIWSVVEAHARKLEKQYPGLVLLPEQV